MSKKNKFDYFAGGKHHATKYNNNPILKRLNNGFMNSLVSLAQIAGSEKIFEIGCGEGQLLGILYDQGYDVRGCDYDPESVEMTNENFKTQKNLDNVATVENLYDIDGNDERIKGRMVICCEVLEHVPDPEKGVQIITSSTNDYFIISVPHEPIWCFLNFIRGKYWKSFGNTPGHINHWTKSGIVKLVSKYADVVTVRTPLPWTMVLGRKRNTEITDQ